MAGLRKNLAATLYANAANVGGQLLLVPVYLYYWGPQRYGWWLVLFAIPACFTFLDAGLGNSLGNALTIAYQRKEFRHAQQMLNAVWKYQTLALALGFALFAAGILFLPLRSWLALEKLEIFEFLATSLLLAFYTMLSLQLGLFTAVFRAAARFDQFVGWNAHAKVVEVGTTIVVLCAGGGFVAAALALALIRMVLLAIYWYVGRRVVPELEMTWSDAPWVDFKNLLTTGIAFMALPLAAGIVNQGSAILLNQKIGPIAVVALSVSRQLARLYYNLFNSLFLALHPELTLAYAAGNLDRFRRLYAGGLGVIIWTAVPAVMAMVLLGPYLIALWTRSQVVVGHLLILLSGIEAVVALLGQNAALPAYASNRHLTVCVSYLISAIVGFVPAVLLVAVGGVAVVPASFAAIGIAFVCHAFFVGSRIVQANPIDLIRLSLSPTIFKLSLGRFPLRITLPSLIVLFGL